MLDTVLWSLVIGFASYRIWRLIGQDKISQLIRDGIEGKYLELIECPWCLGTWIAFGVTGIVAAVVGLAVPVLVALAAAVVTGILGDRG